MVLILALEILGAVLQEEKPPKFVGFDVGRGSVAVLIPAHNEQTLISLTLERILPQMQSGDRILVVADNCSDDTEKIALACGAEVVERFDDKLRGKGYALDYGVRHLEQNPPETLIILDADCLIGEDSIELLSSCSKKYDRPVQALYLMDNPADVGISQKIAAFAQLVNNYVRPLGMSWLGLPCHLLGTGMAFPWSQISQASLASGNIVEDMNLGVDMVRRGSGPIFLPEAKVRSLFPAGQEATKGQRERWEHGHIETILSQTPKLLSQGVLQFQPKLLFFALDLAVFPLALLTILLGLLTILVSVYAYLGGAVGLAALIFLTLCLFATSIIFAWWRFGREILTASELAAIPCYIFMKIPLYAKFLFNKQREWVRTERDDGS